MGSVSYEYPSMTSSANNIPIPETVIMSHPNMKRIGIQAIQLTRLFQIRNLLSNTSQSPPIHCYND